MDLLPLLLAILIVGIAIAGIIWYQLRSRRVPERRPRTKKAKLKKQSIDEIAVTTSKNLSKAQTMEEAFAAGKEGLERITRQIKKSKPQKHRGK